MNDVFHINLDDFDLALIRVGGQAQPTTGQKASHSGHTRQVQRELEQYMEQKSLMSFVKLCRIFNIDPLSKFSFHIIMILMSKHPDRLDVIQTFIAGLHQEHRDKILLDQEAVASFDYSENTFLTSTGDWIALFQYIKLYDLSETDQHELEADVRLQLFITSMRHAQVLSQQMDMEYIVKAFLSIFLINIPAAKILERVILQHDQGMRDRDIELRSLRTVHHFTDNSLHMPAHTQMDSVLLILKNTHPTAEFFATIAGVIEVCAHDHIGKHTKHRQKFSLRRHISEAHVSSQVEYVHTFENWSSQQKFSVTTSICTQRLFYFTQAQCIPIAADVYLKFFDSALLEKVVQGTLHQIDIAAVLLVIKSLRVYDNNIKSLLDFRTQCTVGVNAAKRSNLTRALVLQLYVATWQHESIREQCWQSIIGAYNHTISSSCDLFRKKNTYEFEAVLQSLVKCLLA
jgi:hypothetical protein